MNAGYLDLECDQGTTWSKTITITSTDITGYSFAGQIQKSCLDTSLIVPFTISATTPASGILTISLTPAQTNLLVTTGSTPTAFSTYVYSIMMTNASGNISELLNGNFLVYPQV